MYDAAGRAPTEASMSRVLTDKELRGAVAEGTMIQGGTAASVAGLKYDFRLGDRILLGGRRPISVQALPEIERQRLVLGPGELAFVLSEERVDLPKNVKAELSLKRKLSHYGILVLGGFCVDPGYRGRLLFAMYNFTSIDFPLMPGKKLIAAQFYELDERETPDVTPSEPIEDFPEEFVRFMAAYRPRSAESLQRGLDDLKLVVDELRRELSDKKQWFENFQRKLEETGNLVADNGRQIQALTKNHGELTDDLRVLQKSSERVAAIWTAVGLLVGGLAIAGLVKLLGWV